MIFIFQIFFDALYKKDSKKVIVIELEKTREGWEISKS
ncbi:Lumazine binding domain protein [Bacillus mycoides]|uniref:Lumazine binding domain protein n=1 Tax=Bacillus mycoides TaxID=1405 RepID=C2Y403_BACMY|nr:Lumazine binding domain protein [Bacillus mycoides]